MPKQSQHKAPKRRPGEGLPHSRYIDPLTNHTFHVMAAEQVWMEQKFNELYAEVAVLDFIPYAEFGQFGSYVLSLALSMRTPFGFVRRVELTIGVRKGREYNPMNITYYAKYPDLLLDPSEYAGGKAPLYGSKPVAFECDTRRELVEHVLEVLIINEECITND